MAIAEPYAPQPLVRGLARLREAQTVSRRASAGDRVAIGGFLLLILVALVGPLLAPHSPIQPAGIPFLSPFHGGFLFGTDEVGQDIFTRVLYGLRASLIASAAVITSGVVIGGAIGLVAGTAGGWIDTVLMRITDLFLALPGPVLAIAVVAALGPSYLHTLIAVAIVWWPFYARIVRGEVRALATRPHLEAARLAGIGRVRLARRHLLPGAVPAVLVTASLDVGNLVVTLAALSFLGLGAPAPSPELGSMAARGLQYLLQEWWVPVIPALAVFVVAFLANLAGDGIRDLLGDR
ncbi:MAG TPA: ABC transporter permease [Acidimicrobiales bacterium]|jgi:peptide/nickel transport system permease protein|nr:ABC transporter permease [Acidimicrobiales bacterium]